MFAINRQVELSFRFLQFLPLRVGTGGGVSG